MNWSYPAIFEKSRSGKKAARCKNTVRKDEKVLRDQT
jgi:hypothetical protein